MSKYIDIKNEHQERYSKLFDDCGVFWAFSKEQFEKNKTPLKDGDKYVSIGGGGYLPKGNFDKLQAGLTAVKKWKAEAMRAVKAEEAILHELNNFECFYSCELDDVVEVFEGKYTVEEIRKVYNKYATLETKTAKAQEYAL